jgi:hypothetical protein
MEKISWTDCLKNEVISRRKERTAYNEKKESSRIGHSCVKTAFQNTLLKER